MTDSQKGYKALNHRDVLYRWILQNRRGVNEMVVVASAPVSGQKLIVELPRVVNPQMVPKAIDFALEHGWQPNESGDAFECVLRRGHFVIGRG